MDDTFRNAPEPTKTESEKAFGLEFVAMLGNVKAFILSICSAVVFATLLVSANTMAMSIRERTREVAVLKTLGFTRQAVLGLFVGEAVALSLIGGRSWSPGRLWTGVAYFTLEAGGRVLHHFVGLTSDGRRGDHCGRTSRFAERGGSFLPRVAGEYCGWPSPHWLSKGWMIRSSAF